MANISPYTFQSISVIVPVINETTSFVETVETIINVCGPDLEEIIICPAYFATPACKKIAEELCIKHKIIPVKIVMQNGTFDDALKSLFKIVTGSHFMIQPADLEEDPKMIAVFIKESRNHPEAIITGSRFLSKECSENYSKLKKAFFIFFRKFFQIVYSKKLTDTTFSYRTIPTEKVKNLILKEKSYSVLYEAFLKMMRTGVDVIEVPVVFQKRPEGKSKTKFFKDGFRYLWVFFRVRLADSSKFYVQSSPEIVHKKTF